MNGRLISLDFLRGATIAGMIIVNTPGSWSHVYPPLLHAKWHGTTATDLVFPFFLFIVGVSIVLAYTKRLKSGADKKSLIKKVVWRSLKIYLLGLFLNLFPEFDFANLRYTGVLPRIAIVFLACSLIFLYSDWKTWAKIGLITLVVYWITMVTIPVPGQENISLEPGQNLAAWIDSILLPGRKWQGTWDPEGLLSTFPAIVTGITGMLAGMLWIIKNDPYKKIVYLFSFGFAMFLAGNIWDWFFPINKNLWTSSYVLNTSGLACMAFAASIYLIDILGIKGWTKPGVVFGSNAISAYVLHGVLISLFVIKFGDSSIKESFMNGLTNIGMAAKLASLLWALLYCFLCYIPIWILYKRKIFIKV
jgi:predicted acyltransferase